MSKVDAAEVKESEQPAGQPAADEKAKAPAKTRAAAKPKADAALSTKAIVAAVNDGDTDDPELVDALNDALYRFGAQDPSMELARSWVRVQRRIGVESDKINGIATPEQIGQFADRTGLTLTK